MTKYISIAITLVVIFASVSFSETFRFAVFGDNRPFNNMSDQPALFKDIVKNIEWIHPAFVVGIGDFIYGYGANAKRTKEEYEDFLKVIKEFTMPFYPVVGNHEVAGIGGQRDYVELLKKPLYYSFNYEKNHFIILDTNVNFPNGPFTDKQFTWLKNDLAHATSAQNVFFFMHKPLIEPNGKMAWPNEKMAKKVKETIYAFNSKYHNVRVIFQGHEHLFWKKMINGIDYIITGGAGAPLDGEPQNGGFYHFLLASVDGTHVKVDVFLPNYFNVNYEYSSSDSNVATAVIENKLPPVYNGLKINGLRFVMPKASSYKLNSDIPCSIWKIAPGEDGKNIVWVQASLKFPYTNVESLVKAAVLMFTKRTTQKLFRSTFYYVSVKALSAK
jgi:Icc protein